MNVVHDDQGSREPGLTMSLRAMTAVRTGCRKVSAICWLHGCMSSPTLNQAMTPAQPF